MDDELSIYRMIITPYGSIFNETINCFFIWKISQGSSDFNLIMKAAFEGGYKAKNKALVIMAAILPAFSQTKEQIVLDRIIRL